ncbi:MAG: hypothetical protein ACRC7O_12585, partial [Fimbriiglobus sp.]
PIRDAAAAAGRLANPFKQAVGGATVAPPQGDARKWGGLAAAVFVIALLSGWASVSSGLVNFGEAAKVTAVPTKTAVPAVSPAKAEKAVVPPTKRS